MFLEWQTECQAEEGAASGDQADLQGACQP